MKTWHYESLFVALVMTGTFFLGPGKWPELVCSIAVWVTFMHGQVADRMQEQQYYMTRPTVDCYRWSNRYFVIKEALWITFFVMTGSYAAVAGAGVFCIYPFWRKFYRGKFQDWLMHWRYRFGKQDVEAYKKAFRNKKEILPISKGPTIDELFPKDKNP